MPKGASTHPLYGFFIHGVENTDVLGGSNQNELITDCPFCDKERHFYINVESKLWNCKVCNKGGNYLKFLEEIALRNSSRITTENYQELAVHRELPVEAFYGHGIGYDGEKFTFPIYDERGRFQDLRYYRLKFGKKTSMMSTKGAKVGLFRSEHLGEDLEAPIFLCEGEPDAIALHWLLMKIKKPGIVLGSPGATTFKSDWADWFSGRNVYVFYDNDNAGMEGEMRVHANLENIATSLHYLHWPDSKKEGYDIRDLIKFLAVKKKKPEKCFRLLEQWTHSTPRKLENFGVQGEDGKIRVRERKEDLKPISFGDLIKCYKEFLYIEDTTPIKILLATVFANRLKHDPVWMFLVGAPSGSKSELIQSLKMCQEIEMVSSMTGQTLVSGMLQVGQRDASLLKRMKNRVMAIKDFTTILNLMPMEQNKIFGQLRDAYDGKLDFFYGHNQNKHYEKLHFGIIAGVVSEIEKIGAINRSLGERFLKYNLPLDYTMQTEDKIMDKAFDNMQKGGGESGQRDTLAYAVKRFIEAPVNRPLPQFSRDWLNQIKKLARFSAYMRGFVSKDHLGHMQYKPQTEKPIRIFKQLVSLGQSLAMLESKTEFTETEFKILREVAVSSCPERVQTMVHMLYGMNGHPANLMVMSEKVNFPPATIKYVLDDLRYLGLVKMEGVGGKAYYSLSPSLKELIKDSKVYTIEQGELRSLPLDPSLQSSVKPRRFRLAPPRLLPLSQPQSPLVKLPQS